MVKRILKMEVKLEDGKKRVIFFPVVIDDGQKKMSKKSLLARKENIKKNEYYVKRSRMIN